MTQGATSVAAPLTAATAAPAATVMPGATPSPTAPQSAGVAALTGTVSAIQAQMGQLVSGIAAGNPAALAGGVTGAVNLLQTAESAMSGARLQDALSQLGPGIGLDTFQGVTGGGPGMKDPSVMDAAELAKFGMGPLTPQAGNLLTDEVLKSFGLDPNRIRLAAQGKPDPNAVQAAPATPAAGAKPDDAAAAEEAARKKKANGSTTTGGASAPATPDHPGTPNAPAAPASGGQTSAATDG